MEQVFATERVDEFMEKLGCIQVELGLKQESDFDPEELKPKVTPEMAEIRQLIEKLDALNPPKPCGFGKTVQPQAQKKQEKVE